MKHEIIPPRLEEQGGYVPIVCRRCMCYDLCLPPECPGYIVTGYEQNAFRDINDYNYERFGVEYPCREIEAEMFPVLDSPELEELKARFSDDD